MKRSGIPSLLLFLVLASSACGARYGFAGGGLPQHIRSMAIVPFENETASPELQRELGEQLQRELRGRLGVRDASEARADAVVRGTIRSYELDVPVAFSADPNQSLSSRRKLQIVLDVEIVDQTTGRTLWERRGMRAEGEYAERAEAEGRRQAIQRIVSDIIEGAQSQW
jgi:hypothetical protein